MVTEAPQFVHSETEREQMLTQMREMAGREKLTTAEFKVFCYLLLDRDLTPDDVKRGYDDSESVYPEEQPRIIVEANNPEDDYICITFLDGLSEKSGEAVFLEGERGRLRWMSAPKGSVYSEILGRRIKLQEDFILEKPAILSPQDHARVAKILLDVSQGIGNDTLPSLTIAT